MEVTSVSLPKWKGKDTMSETEPYDKATLKYKKVTVYAEAVRGSYKTLRNITTNIDEREDAVQYTWTGTRCTGYTSVIWPIHPTGMLTLYYGTWEVLGIRPAIEY